jgi:hypothetical protein
MHECAEIADGIAVELSALFEYDARGARVGARFLPVRIAPP